MEAGHVSDLLLTISATTVPSREVIDVVETAEHPKWNYDGAAMWQAVVALYLRSAKRKIILLELRANEVRTGAIREAAHLAAGDDEGLEQGIVDACFSRQLHYEAAEEYADCVAKVIEETMGCKGQD